MPYKRTKNRFHWWSLFLKYNRLSLILIRDKPCVVNGRLFLFNDDGKLYLFYMQNKTFSMKKTSVIFTECTELNLNGKYANGFCVYVSLK